jgi:hypothetical protein
MYKHMRQRRVTPFSLRATFAVVIGCALVTGWLRPVYESFVGNVRVPSWWCYLHLGSMAALLFLVFFLWKRDWKLSMLALGAFVVSYGGDCIPDYVVAAAFGGWEPAVQATGNLSVCSGWLPSLMLVVDTL